MQKLNYPCIKTGDFAKLCNTNKRTLFHYDEIGLFSPAFTDENGYRYYSENQCDVFFTITCLKEIGMPLKEIKKYIDKRSPGLLDRLLLEQQKKIDSEITHLNRIRQVIETKRELVQTGRRLPAPGHTKDIVIEECQDEYLVLSSPVCSSEHDVIIRILTEHIGYCSHHGLNAGHPYGAMLKLSDIMSDRPDTYSYFFTKVITPPHSHDFHVKRKGLYAVSYLRGDYYDITNVEDIYQKLFRYIKKRKLSMGEFSYKEAIIDEIAALHKDDYITKISIPII